MTIEEEISKIVQSTREGLIHTETVVERARLDFAVHQIIENNLAEAMLSPAPYVREMARLIQESKTQ